MEYYIVNPVCTLCHSTLPTTNHILIGCSVALAQGRPGVMIQFRDVPIVPAKFL